MFLVTGITGKVGGAAAQQLLDAGHPVRALAHDPQKAAEWAEKGVDLRRGDFNNVGALASALEGVEGVFLMVPPYSDPDPGFTAARAIIASFQEALRQVPPPRLVALSAVGAQQDGGLGLITATHLLEKGLRGLPFPSAFVRAGSFLENYAAGLDRAASTGVFNSFLVPTDRGFPMVGTEDIGKEIARLLSQGWEGERVVEMGSRISPDDLARAMSETLGKPVEARALPREKWQETMTAMGFPPRGATQYAVMEDAYNAGWIDFGVAGSEPVAATLTPAQVFAQARNT